MAATFTCRAAAAYFVEPVSSGSLVEIACGPATSPENQDRLFSWAAALGYTPVAVERNRKRSVADYLNNTHGDAAFADYTFMLSVSRRF